MGQSSADAPYDLRNRHMGHLIWGTRHGKRLQKAIEDPIGFMYGIYANIWGILMVNGTIYSIH
jgi:hypothetical protein